VRVHKVRKIMRIAGDLFYSCLLIKRRAGKQGNSQLALILDLDDLLGTVRRVRDVKLHKTYQAKRKTSKMNRHLIKSSHETW